MVFTCPYIQQFVPIVAFIYDLIHGIGPQLLPEDSAKSQLPILHAQPEPSIYPVEIFIPGPFPTYTNVGIEVSQGRLSEFLFVHVHYIVLFTLREQY